MFVVVRENDVDVNGTRSKEKMRAKVLATNIDKPNTRGSISHLFSAANRASEIATVRNNHIIMQARRSTKLGLQRATADTLTRHRGRTKVAEVRAVVHCGRGWGKTRGKAATAAAATTAGHRRQPVQRGLAGSKTPPLASTLG